MTWYNSIRNSFVGDILKPYGDRLNDYVKVKNRPYELKPPTLVEAYSAKPETFAEKRARLFETIEIRQNIVSTTGKILLDNIPARINAITGRMLSNQKRYETVSHKFSNPIKWYHIAIIHQMEGEMNWGTYLGNGQSWKKKTTIVPKGRGPFQSWEQGAIDAITQFGLNKIQDWSIGATLETFERWNGWGYVTYHPDINSPYLWSGTNHYTKGKYVADGKYDAWVVSLQIGAAPLLKAVMNKAA
jgi:lysozyme family protein